MSYVSPPESRSRVENIKKRFEANSNDVPSSLTADTNFTKIPSNRNPLRNKSPSNNGFKSNVHSRKKTLQACSSTPVDIPKKPTNTSPTLKSPPVGSIKAERQLSNPYGRGHIRRSPAFRCDKIVKGRNVTGQTSGIRERTRSVVDNRVKLFEDGQDVKCVLKKLNASPPSSNTADAISKSSRPPLQKQAALEDEDESVTVLNSGIALSTSHLTEIPLVNNHNKSKNLSDKVALPNVTDMEKSERVPQPNLKLSQSDAGYASGTKVPNQMPASFLHRYEHNRVKLPSESKLASDKQIVLNSTNVRNNEHKTADAQDKVSSLLDGNKWKTSNGVNGEKVRDALQERGDPKCMTDTLKAALKAPLPPGPPPKKPPRTFAHNSPSPHNVSVPTNSANDPVSDKDLPPRLKFPKNTSEKTNADKTVKPIRSKTESQIMLKKLENILLNHQQGIGNNVLKPKSPMMKRQAEDNATEPESRQPAGRLGPLPSLPSDGELLNSHSESNAKFGGCLNFNCVSTDSSNPMYSQIHFYEKVPEKLSEFFVEVPKNRSPSEGSASKPYGALLLSRSRSEEHIYAEPFDYLNKTQNRGLNIQNRKGQGAAMKSGESVGDLSKIGATLEELHRQMLPSLQPKHITPKSGALHYLCTPIHPDGTTGVAETDLGARSNESITSEPVVPTLAERRVSNESQGLGSDSSSDERKKPPLLRLAALVRGGQTGSGIDVPSKVDRTKIQLLMNQAFGSPLQGLPSSPLELVGSDSDSMASTPDDGGFTTIFPKADDELTGSQLPDANKAGLSAARCVESVMDGEDTSSTNSAEQQEQLTRLSEERKVYVRRVSSRVYHRVRSTATTPSAFPHLFQCILLVGLNLDSSDKKTKVPYIKTKYPLDADVPPHIEHLCFPDARDWPPPVPSTPPSPGSACNDDQSYSLVITGETGVRRFGYCRRVQPEGSSLCLPLAYCIISPFRASGFYYKILAELESRHGQPEWLQTAFIKELYSCQFPGPGQGLKLSTSNTTYNVAGPMCSMVTTVVRRPLDSRLEERDLTQLFSALPVPALLQLFGSLLLERKVILTSNSLSRLSSCIEALQSILYPFSWQHTLIPVLPASLLDICLSPTPYIVGILRGRDASTVPGPIDESMVVDLDESRVLQGVGDEASILPSRLRRCLKVALQLVTNTTQPWDASRNVLVSEAFVRMFVEVCGHYRNHVVTQQDGMKVFERESFIKAVTSQSTRLFLEWFTETAMFSAFMESRLESESEVRGMFDQRCLEHSEEMENNTRLFLRNYKVLNKKVKTFGDRLKDWAPFS